MTLQGQPSFVAGCQAIESGDDAIETWLMLADVIEEAGFLMASWALRAGFRPGYNKKHMYPWSWRRTTSADPVKYFHDAGYLVAEIFSRLPGVLHASTFGCQHTAYATLAESLLDLCEAMALPKSDQIIRKNIR